MKSYLSNANLESPLDLWARDEEGGDRIRERQALIAFAEDNDDSSVSSMKKIAGGLHAMTDYLDQKVSLAKSLKDAYNNYFREKEIVGNLQINVIRGS